MGRIGKLVLPDCERARVPDVPRRSEIQKRRAMQWKAVAQRIKGREKEHLRLSEAILRADNGNVFPADLIVIGVMQRSLMLMRGFLAMLYSGNCLCACALLRLQLDNILRLYASSLFPSGRDTLMAFLQNRPLSKLKAPDGKPLTDKELKIRVGKIYPWLPRVYEKTSGFIHFSSSALISPLTSVSNGQMGIAIGTRSGRQWRPEERLEAAEAFDEATKAVLHLVSSWGHAKAEVGAQREAGRTSTP